MVPAAPMIVPSIAGMLRSLLVKLGNHMPLLECIFEVRKKIIGSLARQIVKTKGGAIHNGIITVTGSPYCHLFHERTR